MVGVEPGPAAAGATRRLLAAHGHSVNIVEAFFETAALPGTFDAIIFSYCVYCYILESSHWIAVLEPANRHLNPDGRIILSYFSAKAPFQTNGIAVMRFAVRLMRSDWRPEQTDVFNRVDIGQRLLQYEHWFAPGELESEVRTPGAPDRPPSADARNADRGAHPLIGKACANPEPARPIHEENRRAGRSSPHKTRREGQRQAQGMGAQGRVDTRFVKAPATSRRRKT